jgi:hypothetical protein
MLGGFSERLLLSKFTTNYKVKKKQNKEHIVQCKKLIVAGGKESWREKKAPY